MKRNILLLAALLLGGWLFAQVPLGISHQAVIRDADGKLMTNKTIGIQVSILQGTAEGTVVYSETHDPMSNMNGLVTYVIGKGSVVEGVFADIDWSDGPYFLKTEVDPGGGTSYSIEGTVQLQSVPYAMHAKTSEDAFDGDMKGASITNLADPTGAQDAATKAYVDLLEARIKQMEEVLYTFTDDRDGNTYKWVKIGNQVWMAENLNFATAGSWCFNYNNAYCGHYGRLYNWHAVMNGASSSSANPSGVQGVCPAGWHVPSDAEWTQLVDYVVSQGYPNSNVVNGAGNALKSCYQIDSPLGLPCNTSDHPRWNSHSTHYGTDEFGFSALPGGYQCISGSFHYLGSYGYWWSATEYSSSSAWSRFIYYDVGNVFRYYNDKMYGFSLRCVRDN